MENDYGKILKDNKITVFVPHGNSMLPFLKSEGETVIVAEKTARLNKLDAALFKRADGTFVLHRIIDVKSDGYVFVGDFTEEKEFVAEDFVLGVMIGYYKGDEIVDVSAPEYKEVILKYYANEKSRVRRIKRARFVSTLKAKVNAVKKRIKK